MLFVLLRFGLLSGLLSALLSARLFYLHLYWNVRFFCISIIYFSTKNNDFFQIWISFSLLFFFQNRNHIYPLLNGMVSFWSLLDSDAKYRMLDKIRARYAEELRQANQRLEHINDKYRKIVKVGQGKRSTSFLKNRSIIWVTASNSKRSKRALRLEK